MQNHVYFMSKDGDKMEKSYKYIINPLKSQKNPSSFEHTEV